MTADTDTHARAWAIAAKHGGCLGNWIPCKVDCVCWAEAQAQLRAEAAAAGRGPGPCADKVVTCTLVTPAGTRYVGTNWCRSAQPTCPRAPGEGYEKCRSLCDQPGHAETNALLAAGAAAAGAHAYIEGITFACRSCQEDLFGAGVAAFTIGPPPEKT